MNMKWKVIENFENYEISNTGLIRKGNLLLKPYNRGEYLKIKLSKDRKRHIFFIHRLVAITFLLNPNNLPIVNHIDENRSNNNVENLEWCTQQYNVNHGNAQLKRNISRNIGVIQMDLEGNELNKFISAAEAARYLGKSINGNIRKCCINNKTAYGYKWKRQNG